MAALIPVQGGRRVHSTPTNCRRHPLALTLPWLAWACLCLGLGLSLAPSAWAKPKTSVADLRYGVSLYNYYQHDYLSALTELMIADTRDGIQRHDEHPELIAGGISLAFGMENHAERLFYQLLQNNDRPQSQRDAAWFYLGKLHYTRGNWTDAELSFARVGDQLSPYLAAEKESLRINLQIRREQLVPVPLRQLGDKQLQDWSPYALYNLGGAFARQGDYNQARDYYRALVKANIPEGFRAAREYLALRDRAFTALGYTYLQEKSYSAAIAEFTQVRLRQPGANRALLGYGWAALQQEQYTLALRPWQQLSQGSLLYPEVQEALLALAFTYEKLGAEGEALRAYEQAEQRFAEELSRLREMRASLTQGELLTLIGSPPESDSRLREASEDPTQLTAAITDEGNNWLKLSQTSIIKTRSAYLSHLFAQNNFQTQVLDLRDLLRLRSLLADWQQKLVLYTDMLHEKQALRSRSEDQQTRDQLHQTQILLVEQQTQIEEQIAAIDAREDYLALADEDTRDFQQRVERSQRTLDRMGAADEETREQAQRLRLYRGILLWRAAQDYPDHRWQLEKQRLAIATGLTQLQETRARIERITAENEDLLPQLDRLARLQVDTDIHLEATESLIDTRSAALRETVDRELARRETQQRGYLAQAQLSVARLYDGALRSQTP